MRSLAPIVYFAYNRPDHTLQTLDALSKSLLANESTLWIYIDGPKENASTITLTNIEAVKKIVLQKKWCGTVNVVIAEKNEGLFKSIVHGITEAVNRFGKVIVMEDDVLVSAGFLTYMNDALDIYENTPQVMHVSAFSKPEFNSMDIKETTYFFNHTTCWGWATWKRAWDHFNPNALAVHQAVKLKGNIKRLNMDGTFEFFWGLKAVANGKLRSWNTVWHSVVFLHDGLCLHPQKSLVSNIGHDGSGTNCIPDERFKIDIEALADVIPVTVIPLTEHEGIKKHYMQLHSFTYKFVFGLKHYLRYLVRY